MLVVLHAFDAALKKNPRVEMKDLDTRLAEFAQEVPQDQVDAARQALKLGEQSLLELNIPSAIQQLGDAVTQLAKVLPYIKKQELADAMAALAVSHYENGDKAAGRRQFVRLLVWRPDYTYDPSKLSPKYLGTFEEAQREVLKLKQGTLQITTDPAGAQAYVDGKSIGLTPCTTEPLPAGEHFVTIKKEGYQKSAVGATVIAKKETALAVPLSRNEKYLLVEQAIDSIQKTIGTETYDPAIDNFRQTLFIDQAVFVRAKPGAAGAVDVEAWLYDLRTRRKLTHVMGSLAKDKDQAEAKAGQLVTGLYTNVNYAGELELPQEKLPPKPKERPPLYKTWWFWTAAAAVVVGVVAAVIAVIETRGPSCPDADVCPVIRF
jgi:hypothetical protein